MSLHLIESRRIPVTARLRNPGGVATSILMHAGLVTAALLLATGHVIPKSPPAEISKVTFVTPPPVERVFDARSPRSASRPSENQLQTIANIGVPDMQVPDISLPTTAHTAVDFYGKRAAISIDGSLTSGGVPGGIGLGVFENTQVDKPVMLLPGMPVPRYPETLRAAGIQDSVLLMFIVDTLGRVEMKSLETQNSAHPAFVQAVRQSLVLARFKPAEVGGTLVRQRVMQVFLFSLTR